MTKPIWLLSVFLSFGLCTVMVLSPSSIQGEYLDAELNTAPKEFNITGNVVKANPYHGCSDYVNVEEVMGNIVLVLDDTTCSWDQKVKEAWRHQAKGFLLLSVGTGVPTLGYHYSGIKVPDKYAIPSLNFVHAENLEEALDNGETVIVNMISTTRNPWLELGYGGAGVFFQVFFELYAFATAALAAYRLRGFMQVQKAKFTVSQVCLVIEIITAILRMVYMIHPINIGAKYYMGDLDTFFLTFPNTLGLISTIFITFYWQELLIKYNTNFGNAILNNLDKMRIPFFVAVVILLAIELFGDLIRINRVIKIGTNIYIFTAIITAVLLGIVGTFFLVTSIRLKLLIDGILSRNLQKRKLQRVTILIITVGAAMVSSFIITVIFASNLNTISRDGSFLIWWILFFSYFSTSFCTVCALEPPKPKKQGSTTPGSTNPLNKTNTSESLGDSSVNSSSV